MLGKEVALEMKDHSRHLERETRERKSFVRKGKVKGQAVEGSNEAKVLPADVVVVRGTVSEGRRINIILNVV